MRNHLAGGLTEPDIKQELAKEREADGNEGRGTLNGELVV
jgi:hypothetical protein